MLRPTHLLHSSPYPHLPSRHFQCVLGSIERWFPIAFLSVFLWRHHLPASMSSIARPSDSLSLGARISRRGLGRPPRTLFHRVTTRRWRGGHLGGRGF